MCNIPRKKKTKPEGKECLEDHSKMGAFKLTHLTKHMYSGAVPKGVIFTLLALR